jgi:hypothetical protein
MWARNGDARDDQRSLVVEAGVLMIVWTVLFFITIAMLLANMPVRFWVILLSATVAILLIGGLSAG